jgi:4-hydroxybenzoate polyprenyltransferase
MCDHPTGGCDAGRRIESRLWSGDEGGGEPGDLIEEEPGASRAESTAAGGLDSAWARALVTAARPRQYTKNLLTLAGIVFAGETRDPALWPRALLVLVVYCAASSAAYLYNDVRDIRGDQLHPVKRHRPIASGALPARIAWSAALALVVAALGGAAVLGWRSLELVCLFLLLQVLYSSGLKRVPLLDVALIAGLFEMRAIAGAEAVSVAISKWLLVCTALLAAFLALAKRRAELRLIGDGVAGRGVLRWYSTAFLDRLLALTVVASAVAYLAYSIAGPTPWLVTTVPFVLLGLFRYVTLLYRGGHGEEPENTLLTDVVLLVTVTGWAVACAVILVVVT